MIHWNWGLLRRKRLRCYLICEFSSMTLRDIAKDTDDSTASTKTSLIHAGA